MPVSLRFAAGFALFLVYACGTSAPPPDSPPPPRPRPIVAAPEQDPCDAARERLSRAAVAHVDALDSKRAEAAELYDMAGPASYPEYAGELDVYGDHRAQVTSLAETVASGASIPVVPRFRFAPWDTEETLDAFVAALVHARHACGPEQSEPEPEPPPPLAPEPPPDNWY